MLSGMTYLNDLIMQALEQRSELLTSLHSEQTNTYRLFHGTNEGFPGLTVDRYGPQLLIQAFHKPLRPEQQAEIVTACASIFEPQEIIYNDRSTPNSRRPDVDVASPEYHCEELGVKYVVQGKHKGQDPFLFLDFRAARRWIQKQAEGKSVLNLFAYTGGIGLCAALAGAKECWNIDFAHAALELGRKNAALNQIPSKKMMFIKSDFFTAVRQLADLPVKQRRNKGQKPRGFLELSPRSFDIVVLDPPRLSKSPFGTVDLVRDYPSVLKPALLATAPKGQLLCTNNCAEIHLETWLKTVLSCAKKAGREIQSYEIIQPEADFPSPDGNYPLKMAVLQL